ncbi:response regulator [Nonlabens tegetincola]|uniref:LytR/AlgR family response regulator transcription factor n=1 Tax=Nonlabens tegetincola TaxID=323273 RepID=UPI0030C820AA
MKTYSTILIDDEQNALQNLSNKIQRYCIDLDITHTFQNPKEAIIEINKNPPDLLFLDIQMPGMTGFELLKQVKNLRSQVIFSTAYSEHALEAIKQSAVDYILKPVDKDELINAVQKAIDNILNTNIDQNDKLVQLMNKMIERDHKLKIPTQKGISFIPQEEVIHLEGYDGYTKIHIADGSTIMSSYSLGKFTDQLEDYFFKCHKSHIINIKAVTAFENEGYLVMGNDYRVPITKTYKKTFLDLF